MRRTNDELCIAPTKSNWEDELRNKALQKAYRNQPRFAKRARFDWSAHNACEGRVFRDT